MTAKRFRIAFSFAGEKRDFVEQVVRILAQRFSEAAILYDRYHKAEFSRADLAFYLPDLYEKDSELVVAVFCPDYDTKEWCGLEWNAIYGLLKARRVGEVMLTRFGHAEGKGLRGLAGYTDLDGLAPQQAADAILERLALNEGRPKDHYLHIRPNHSSQTTMPNNLPRLQYFFGRTEELKKIAEALAPDARGWGVLIDGPGGIGKTSLAIRAAELAPEGQFSRIIFLSAKERELTADGQRSLGTFVLPGYVEMLNAISRELDLKDIEKSPEKERPELILRALRASQLLLVLDNLETLPENDRDHLFTFLNRLPTGCSAIVTSRRRADASAAIIRLDKLDWPAARDLIGGLSKSNGLLRQISDADQRALYEETGGNPLLIRWVASQLGLGHCRSIAGALGFLRSAPAGNNPLEFIFGDLLDTFTVNETKVLAALTHFSTAMESRFIAELAGINESAATGALSDLSSRALVMPDLEERRFALVPLVADFLRRKRPEVVAETGGRLQESAYALILENGREYECFPALDAAWSTVAAALPMFIAGANSRLQAVCGALDMFLGFTGRWDEQLLLSQQAESKAVSVSDHSEAGRRAYDAAWIHYMREQPDAMIACADRAATHWEGAKMGANDRAALVRMRGLAYRLKADYSSAIAAFEEALTLARVVTTESAEVAMTLNSLAGAKVEAGDVAGAERDFGESLRVARAVGYDEGVAYITGNMAGMALDRKDWTRAGALAKEALIMAETVGRRDLIAAECHRIAQALVEQGKSNEALLYAQREVEILMSLDTPQLDSARSLLRRCEFEAGVGEARRD